MRTTPIILFFLFCVSFIAKAQKQEKLCIFFEEDNKYTSVNINNTSETSKIKASFSILKEGFETKEKQEKAMEEYIKNIFDETAFPVYYISFISMNEPEKFSSLNEINCLYCVNANEFRKKTTKNLLKLEVVFFTLFIKQNKMNT